MGRIALVVVLAAAAAALAAAPAAPAADPQRVVGDRWEWPVPLPQWYWGWARRRTFGRVYPRPAAAPHEIPGWAWRRLSVQTGAGIEQRLRHCSVDAVENSWGAGGVEIAKLVRSDQNPGWFVMRLRSYDRWQLLYAGVDQDAIQPDPLEVRAKVPCDIRPAFATPRR